MQIHRNITNETIQPEHYQRELQIHRNITIVSYKPTETIQPELYLCGLQIHPNEVIKKTKINNYRQKSIAITAGNEISDVEIDIRQIVFSGLQTHI